MKTTLLITFALALPVFAGPSAKEVVAPASAPCIFTWFTGASVGYLTEFEEPMYNLHIGTDTCWNLGGWNLALFAEVGYTEKDEDWSGSNQLAGAIALATPTVGESFSIEEASDYLSDIADLGFDTGYDLDILPITLNAKLERQLTGNLNAYFGAGLGAALVDFSVDAGPFGDLSDDDWVFTAQIFAGLNYNVTQAFEIYGGARWIYYDDPSFSGSGISGSLELDDDFLLELGGRFNF